MADREREWEDMLGNPRQVRRAFESGLKDKEQREKNYHDNIAARNKIFGDVADMSPEDFPPPYNEEQRDRLYDKGVYKESQLPSYRRAYKRGKQRGTTPSADAEGTGAPQQQQLLPGQRAGESFSSWLQRQEEHSSRWNRLPDDNDGQEELAAKQRRGQPIYGLDPVTGEQVPVEQMQTPKKKQNTSTQQEDSDKTDEQLQREYAQGASDAYTRGYDAQLDAYKSARQGEQDLINSLGVSQERMDAYNARRADNEKARRNDALWRGLSTIVDMGIAAGHGNVYERKPRDVDYDKTRQLIDAEENSEYMQMMKQRQQAQNQFDQRADQAARAGGDAALKGYLKEVDAAEKERLSEINNAFKAEYQEKQMQLKRELETKRGSRSGGGSRTNKDLVTINGTSGAIKVSHAMLNDYYNSLIDVINGTETLNDRGKKTHALKSACIRAGLLDENGNLTYGASQKIQAMMVNGGRPYPSFFDDYVSAAVRQELINQWNDVLASGGATTTSATTTSGRSQSGGSDDAPPSRRGGGGSDNAPPSRR